MIHCQVNIKSYRALDHAGKESALKTIKVAGTDIHDLVMEILLIVAGVGSHCESMGTEAIEDYWSTLLAGVNRMHDGWIEQHKREPQYPAWIVVATKDGPKR